MELISTDKAKYLDLVPSDWIRITISEIFKFSSGKAKPKKTSKIRTEKFPFPVYGGNGILGYSDEFIFDEPKLILGRVGEYCGCAHLTEKYSWISDNALYAKDICKEIDYNYFKFFFEFFDINRFSNKNGQPLITQGNISNLVIAKPQLDIQNKISFILSTLQNAIEKQQQIIDTTQALKKSLLHQLFTQGTKGEKLKETEIGMMPDSWLAVEIGSILNRSTQRNPSGKPDEMFKYVDVSGVSNQSFSITTFSSVKGKEAPSRARKVMLENDILFATVRPTLQRIAIVPKELNDQICSTGYCVLRPNAKKIISDYLYYYLQSNMILRKMEEMQKGASYPAVSDSNVKECLFPFAPMAEQELISKSLNALTNKISASLKKKEIYESLLKTLLNELMTGSIRVDQLEFDV